MKIVVLSADRSICNGVLAYEALSAVGVLATLLRRSGHEVYACDVHSPREADGKNPEQWTDRKAAISDCDAFMVFSFDSWATLFDVGYAIGIGKPVAVLSNRDVDSHVTEFGATLCNTSDALLSWLDGVAHR